MNSTTTGRAAQSGSSGHRAERSDAVRNRGKLLEAAAEVFAERGTEASIAEIAERAGVGKGTVFRHFATKEDLLASIVIDLVDGLAGTARRLAQDDDASSSLYDFMATGVELLVRDRAFCEVVGEPSLADDRLRSAIARLVDQVQVLVSRAVEQGVIRPDLTGTDVVLLLAGVQQTAQPLLTAHPDLWRRYLRLVVDGMRFNGDPLPALPAPPGGLTDDLERWRA
ncbi:TetR/AcrR family transcriptional regulator [Promicromonospora sp. MEB111]|uniref:TetR/AcrR family transcriptional regulator n=1 Tax=Promicromonospora sp. MEB111 TaxID=3040301 RepID=UPI00254DC5F8|nr:TetR/AcrR family transcriptional regulator [Promicromonospora sp. MEB111]